MDSAAMLADCEGVFNRVLAGITRTGSKKSPTLSAVRTQLLSFIEDPVDLPMYNIFIPNPVSLSEIRKRLNPAEETCYVSPVPFAIDFRRMLSNFIRFNWADKNTANHRLDARKLLLQFEDEFEVVFPLLCTAHPYLATVLTAAEKLFKVPGVSSPIGAIYPFMHQLSTYYEDQQYPAKYLNIVKKPMSFALILEKIIERIYFAPDSAAAAPAKKGSKKSSKSSAAAGPLVPYYHYETNTMAEILADVDLLKANMLAYCASTGESPDEAVLTDVNAVLASLHGQLDSAVVQLPGALPTAPAAEAPSAAPKITISRQNSAASTVSISSNASGGGSKSNRKSTGGGDKRAESVSSIAVPSTSSELPSSGATSSLTAELKLSAPASSAAAPRGPKGGDPNVAELAPAALTANVLKSIFMDVLQTVQLHYLLPKPPTDPALLAKYVPYKVPTSGPFIKAVDPIAFPEYHQVISQPMNLVAMEKKISTGKYTTLLQSNNSIGKSVTLSSKQTIEGSSASEVIAEAPVSSVSAATDAIWLFRNDMALIRANAHAFNTGDQGLELRFMADSLYEYFEYLLQSMLSKLSQGSWMPSTEAILNKMTGVGLGLTVAQTASANLTAEHTANKLLTVFNSMFYTHNGEEQAADAAEAGYAKMRTKDGKALQHEVLLKRWLHILPPLSTAAASAALVPSHRPIVLSTLQPHQRESLRSLPEIDMDAADPPAHPDSVNIFLTHAEAERVEKERIDHEKRLAQQAKSAQRSSSASSSVNGVSGVMSPTAPPFSRNQSVSGEPGSMEIDDGDNGDFDRGTSSVGTINLNVGGAKKAPRASSGASKGKRKSSAAAANDPDADYDAPSAAAAPFEPPAEIVPAAPQIQYRARELAPWERTALGILNYIGRHDYVDINRNKCMCNFFVPAVDINPSQAEEYLKVVREPMDLLLLRNMLEIGGTAGPEGIQAVVDPQDFYRKLVSVFGNTIRFNSKTGGDSSYSAKLIRRCKLMIKLSKWQCMEKLPLLTEEEEAKARAQSKIKPDSAEDDTDASTLFLSINARKKHREDRVESYLKKYGPTASDQKISMPDARSFMKSLDRQCGRTSRDKLVYSWLSEPVAVNVSDYSIYVRNPMDIGLIKSKLEDFKYSTYYDLVQDIELVFNNAVEYNKVYMERDETSREIYNKATSWLELLSELVNTSFSMDVAERWGKHEVVQIEAEGERLREMDKEREMQEERRLLYLEEQARRREVDAQFAADLDTGRKKQETAKLLQAQRAVDELESGFVNEESEKKLAEQKRKEGVSNVSLPTCVVTSSKMLEKFTYFAMQAKVTAGSDTPAPLPTTYFPVLPLILPFSDAPSSRIMTTVTRSIEAESATNSASESSSSHSASQALPPPSAASSSAAMPPPAAVGSSSAAAGNAAAMPPPTLRLALAAAPATDAQQKPATGTAVSAASSAPASRARVALTRTQEAFLRSQLLRHRSRHRSWDIWMRRPGVITSDDVPSSKRAITDSTTPGAQTEVETAAASGVAPDHENEVLGKFVEVDLAATAEPTAKSGSSGVSMSVLPVVKTKKRRVAFNLSTEDN